MPQQILVLGASRSGTAALQRAVSDATGLSPVVMATQLGFLHRAAQAMKSHADAVIAAEPDALSTISLQADLIRFWKGLLEGRQGGERDGLVISAPEILSDCPNLKAARTLMALSPEWQCIAIQRHPVDFVSSRLRARPEIDFATHCLLWANAAQQLRKLKGTSGSRVLVLNHADLLGAPEEVGTRIASFLRLDEEAGRVMTRSLNEGRPGRSATFLYDTLVRLKDTSWSAPEIALFHFLCKEEAIALGYAVDIEGVEQIRPLNLLRTVVERCRVSGKWVADVSDGNDFQPRIKCGDGSGAAGALHIGPVSAGERRRLRLLLLPEIASGNSELRFDIVHSLSRRPIFGRTFLLKQNVELSVDSMLPVHEGMVDMVFSSEDGAAPFELLLRHASLSHA
jgi:hypothetical protein